MALRDSHPNRNVSKRSCLFLPVYSDCKNRQHFQCQLWCIEFIVVLFSCSATWYWAQRGELWPVTREINMPITWKKCISLLVNVQEGLSNSTTHYIIYRKDILGIHFVTNDNFISKIHFSLFNGINKKFCEYQSTKVYIILKLFTDVGIECRL